MLGFNAISVVPISALESIAVSPVIILTGQGDGDYPRHKGVRPLPRFRPKIENDLEDVLALVETITPDTRVSENKKTAKAALAVIAQIEPADYTTPIANIQKAITKVSKNAAKHEGLKAAVDSIIKEVDAVIADMQATQKRKVKRRREEEAIVSWLLSTISKLSLLPA